MEDVMEDVSEDGGRRTEDVVLIPNFFRNGRNNSSTFSSSGSSQLAKNRNAKLNLSKNL